MSFTNLFLSLDRQQSPLNNKQMLETLKEYSLLSYDMFWFWPKKIVQHFFINSGMVINPELMTWLSSVYNGRETLETAYKALLNSPSHEHEKEVTVDVKYESIERDDI